MSRIVVLLLSLTLILSGCQFTGALLGPTAPASPGTSGPGASVAASPTLLPAATPTPTPFRTPRPTARPTPRPTPTAPGGIQTLAIGQRDASPDVPASDLRKLVAGNTDFALDMWQRLLKTQKGNIVFSPYSISVAFAMQDAGALGRTASQIERVLHFRLPTARLDAAMNKLALALASRANKQVTLKVANRLFGAQLFSFRKPFLREITRNFGAPMAAVDFAGDPEAARKLINKWVAGQTAQRILDLIPKDQITRYTDLVLVNAIYLNAKWLVPFAADATSDGRFYLTTGKHVQVPMMYGDQSVPIAITDDYQALELPYKGGKLAMLLVMPTAGTFASFQRSLDAAGLSDVIDSLDNQYAALSLPKFSTRTKLDLGSTLKAMGIKDAFDPLAADLYGISAYPRSDLEHRLHISKVFHQAFIKVAEKGTEAAAATAIIDSGTGGGGPEMSVRIDHPFLWFIRDRVTGTILFMGRVLDPSQTAR
jgi:serpin B